MKAEALDLATLTYIADAVAPRSDVYLTVSSAKPELYGKALVWDTKSKSPHEEAMRQLPSELRASSQDSRITVFRVLSEEKDYMGTYSKSDKDAYRLIIRVSVAHWPDNVPLGVYTITSDAPERRPVRQTRQLGQLTGDPIADWIQTLNRRPSTEIGVATSLPNTIFVPPIQTESTPKKKTFEEVMKENEEWMNRHLDRSK